MISSQMSSEFEQLLDQIGDIGREKHTNALISAAQNNKSFIKKTLRDLPRLSDAKAHSGIVISAGPSVHKRESIQRILDSGYQGTTIAVDGAYNACLKIGLIPDYVVTLDPHPTRIVRWFGDPEFEAHTAEDDYFQRQDLDVGLRERLIEQNAQHIQAVNKHASKTKLIIASSAPANLVQRTGEAGFDSYWWHPLVDDPRQEGSLTRKLYDIVPLPCLNTGGTVGTAAWVFANVTLKISKVAMVGMDLGYYPETPIEKTQTYYELAKHAGTLEGIEKYFIKTKSAFGNEEYFTDPTYRWYFKNFTELLDKSDRLSYNCTEGGVLTHEKIRCLPLNDFLTEVRRG